MANPSTTACTTGISSGSSGCGGGSNNGNAVILETLTGKGNITSQYVLTVNEALQTGEQFLGSGYKEIGNPGSGVYRNGIRQFRIDKNSILGNHDPGVPHAHYEIIGPNDKAITNNHVPIIP